MIPTWRDDDAVRERLEQSLALLVVLTGVVLFGLWYARGVITWVAQIASALPGH